MNIEFYNRQGYWIEENIFSEMECEALIKASKSLDNYQIESYKPVMMPHRIDSIFTAVLRSPRLVPPVENIIGGKASGLQTEYFYCPPETKGFALHQDNFFVQAPADKFVSAWIALVDTDRINGGLVIYPGTHKLGLLPVRELDVSDDTAQDPNARRTECIVPDAYKPVHISVPRGACVFIHGNIVHGSNTNHSEGWRHVLLCTYIRKGSPFRAGDYAQREEVEL